MTNIQELLESSSAELLVPLSTEYLCDLCHHPLLEPVHTQCGCRFCRGCFLNHFINSGKQKGCPNQCMRFEDDIFAETAITDDFVARRKIGEAEVRCMNSQCGAVMELRLLMGHMDVCIDLVECAYKHFGCVEDRLTKLDLENHYKMASLTHSELIIKHVQNQKEEIGRDREERREIEEQTQKKLDALQAQFDKLTRDHANQRTRIVETSKKLDAVLKQSCSPTLVDPEANSRIETSLMAIESRMQQLEWLSATGFRWEVPQLSSKRSGASNTTPGGGTRAKNVLSDSFYVRGYRLCLRLYPGGIRDPAYLALGVFIMPGELDDRVLWPLPHEVCLTLMQAQASPGGDGAAVSITSTPAQVSYRFQYASSANKAHYIRPGRDTRLLLEMAENFVNHRTLLTTPGLLLDDTMAIQITLI